MASSRQYLLTSESVTEGHLDKGEREAAQVPA